MKIYKVENKDIYVAEQFLKCLRKTQVRLSKSDLGLPYLHRDSP